MRSTATLDRVEYRELDEWPGYRVGADGSIWSQKDHGGNLTGEWRRLTARPLKSAYLYVHLRRGALSKTVMVHKLVLTAFVGPCPEGMECCHFPDRDPANNRLENLRWDTTKENSADRELHGNTARGERSGRAILMEPDVIAIRAAVAAGTPQAALGRLYGVSRHVIYQLVKRNTWVHV